MPLHDWANRTEWSSVHQFWITELARDLRRKLPPGFRAVIGSTPFVALGGDLGIPDVATIRIPNLEAATGESAGVPAPDAEVMVAELESDATVTIQRDGCLIAVIELVSPRNKDRVDARDYYGSRYVNYLRGGVHLMLVDVHRRPRDFSFTRWIAEELSAALPAGRAPAAVAYRAGPAGQSDGRRVDVWHRPLTVGEPIPPLPLPIDYDRAVMVDLEATYMRAAADSYVE